MADGTTVDSLQIEVEAASSEAAEKIQALTDALKGLQSATKGQFGDISRQIKSVGDAAGQTDGKSGRSKRKITDEASSPATQAKVSEIEQVTAKMAGLEEATQKAAESSGAVSSGIEEVASRSISVSTKIEKLTSAWQSLKSVISDTKNIANGGFTGGAEAGSKEAAKNIAESKKRLNELKTELQAQKSAWSYIAPKNIFSNLETGIASLMVRIPKLTGAVLGIKSAFSTVIAPGRRLLGILKSFGGISLKGLKSVGKIVLSQVVRPFSIAIKEIEKWKSSIGRIAFYRAVRSAIKAVTDGFKEGTDNLYQYSRLAGTEFAPAMNSLATSALYLKNSLGAMAAPLIQAIAPAVDFLIDKFVALLNVIGKVFAALTGKSTYSQAIKYPKEYADATNEASSALKKFLLGIDELNIMDSPSGGGAGGAGDFGSMFEEVEVPSDTLDWAQQIRDAIEKGDWRGAGALLADKLNEVVESWDSYAWGKRLGTLVNNGLNAAYGFLKKFDFAALGSKVADGLNGLFDSVKWDLLGRTFAAKWNALVDFIYGFVTTFDWARMGSAIAAAVNGWFDEIEWEKAAETFNIGLRGLITSMRTFIAETNWYSIGYDIATFLNALDWAGLLSGLAATIAEGLNAVVTAVGTLVSELEWNKIGTAVGTAINDFFATFDWAGFFTGAANLASGILSGLTSAVETTNWKTIGEKIINGLKAVDWKGLLSGVGTFIGETFVAALDLFFSDPVGMLEIGGEIIAGLFQGIVNALAEIGTWLKENLVDPIVDGVKGLFGIHSPSTVFSEIGQFLIEGLFQGISGAWQSIVDFFGNGIETLKTNFFQGWENIKSAASTAWENIKTNLGTTWETIKTSAGEKFAAVKESISAAWENMKTSTSEKWESIKSTLGSTWDSLKTTAGERFETIRSGISEAWESVKSTTSEKWESIKAALSQAWDNVKTTAKEKFEAVRSTISDVWSGIKESASSWGADICSGLANGIRGAVGAVKSAASFVAGKISEYLHFSEPDVGPLSDFHTYMPDMMDLLAKGIRDNASLAVSAVSELAGDMSNAFRGVTASELEFPTHENPYVSYVSNMESAPPQTGNGTESLSESMRGANGEVISAIFAGVAQIVEAISENGDRPINLDWNKVAYNVTSTQNRQNKMYGKTLQNT